MDASGGGKVKKLSSIFTVVILAILLFKFINYDENRFDTYWEERGSYDYLLTKADSLVEDCDKYHSNSCDDLVKAAYPLPEFVLPSSFFARKDFIERQHYFLTEQYKNLENNLAIAQKQFANEGKEKLRVERENLTVLIEKSKQFPSLDSLVTQGENLLNEEGDSWILSEKISKLSKALSQNLEKAVREKEAQIIADEDNVQEYIESPAQENFYEAQYKSGSTDTVTSLSNSISPDYSTYNINVTRCNNDSEPQSCVRNMSIVWALH